MLLERRNPGKHPLAGLSCGVNTTRKASMTVVGLCKGMDMSEFEYDAKGAGGPCGWGKRVRSSVPTD